MGKSKKEKKSKKAKKEKKEKRKEKKERVTNSQGPAPSTSRAAGSYSSTMGEALEFAFGGSASSSGDSRSKTKSDAAVAAEKEAALFKSRHINAASHAAAIEDMHRRFADQQAERTASASASCSSAAGAVEERHVTDTDINEASAKLMRAEMAGEESRLPRLKANLKNLRTAKERGLKIRIKRKGPEAQAEAGLTEASARCLDGGLKRRREEAAAAAVTEQSSLMDLVRRERATNARDSALEFTRLHMRAAMEEHFDSEMGENRGEEVKKRKKEKVGRGGEKTPHTVVDKAPSGTKCEWCIDNRKKHLVVSTGDSCYLTLPNHASMVTGHCYIVPLRHITSGAHMDEDAWEEVMRFRKQLGKMFVEQFGKDCELLVLETAWSLRPHRHTFFECLPIVDPEIAAMATAYYKKEYSEAGPRWSKNKKFIEVRRGDVYRAVPRGFPYLSAAFDVHHDTCFVHVIDDDKMYSDFFNREIIGGIMDVDPLLWRRPPQEKFNAELQKVVDFEKIWRPFDLWEKEDSD